MSYVSYDLPDNIDATAAIRNEKIVAGPAAYFATSPATTNIPVPQQLPTPSEIRSKVVSTFCIRWCPSDVIPEPSSRLGCLMVLVLINRCLNLSTCSGSRSNGSELSTGAGACCGGCDSRCGRLPPSMMNSLRLEVNLLACFYHTLIALSRLITLNYPLINSPDVNMLYT